MDDQSTNPLGSNQPNQQTPGGAMPPAQGQPTGQTPILDPSLTGASMGAGQGTGPLDPLFGGQDDQGMLTDFTGAKFDPKQIQNAQIPPHTLKFDEKHFLDLLAGSISLTFTEKLQIVKTIPKLKQEQIDELIRILEDEKVKFAELNQKHLQKLKELEAKHKMEWEQLEMKAEESMQKESDQKKADDLRKELGLDDSDDDQQLPKAA